MKSNRDNPILIENDEWICLKCITDERASIFPFGILNNFEIINLNSFDSIYLSEQVPEFDIFSDAINTNNLDNSNDIDENIVHSINSRYYSCQEFFKINCNSNSLKLYHTNVNGFSCHVDTLRDFLVQCDTDFDAICISETSYQLDNAISNNDLLKNYSTPFVTNTKSSKGGVAIFVKENLVVKEREDLKICTDEFESVWIEITNKKSKNVIIGCSYRHPHNNNIDDYSNYISKCLNKLCKENKEVYLAGDFNIDLLKYETNNKYQDFYNLLSSSGFLPLILQPTRITKETSSIIDNIYTNTFNKESTSGNILIEIADHLAQFVIVHKELTKMPTSYQYKRDFSKFNEDI